MSPMVKLPLALEHALLGFLREHPMHAYEMHQQLLQTEAIGLVWHLKQSHLYALLTCLEDAGYITSATKPQGTRPPRKVLSLTPAGQTTFDRWLTTPVEHGRDFRQEFLWRWPIPRRRTPPLPSTRGRRCNSRFEKRKSCWCSRTTPELTHRSDNQ